MATGVVKRGSEVQDYKGYGFITVDGSKDIFFHEKSLTGDLAVRKLQKDDKVEFDIEQTEKGLNAINIKLVGDEAEDTTEAQDTEVSEDTEAQPEAEEAVS